MPFVKTVKDKAYFKRYQVKYRRRREGKTDYYARKRLITQAKNKYNSPKYRLVVRFTNRDVICQIVYAKIVGDVVLASAYSHELPRYGVTVGLTNYAAAYCTGLLLARRALTQLGLADKYEGVTEVDGTFAPTEVMDGEDAPRPFKCFLDVGLKRTSTGAKIFAAMKGASDGGIFVPHSESRFPGYDREEKAMDAEMLRSYIFGGHVTDYMETMEDEDAEKFNRHFSRYLKAGITADTLEDMYSKAHAAIRADPSPSPKKQVKAPAGGYKKFRPARLTLEQRREKIAAKKEEFMRNMQA